MANLKEVRIRITSVSSTQQITSAMKMVSAAKLRKAQDAVTAMRPYAGKLKEILENLSASLSDGKYSQQREVKNVLLVVITSNRGLCGGFNANVIKQASRLAREEYKGANVTILNIGKKGGDFFKKSPLANITGDMAQNTNELFDRLTFANVAPVAEKVMELFAAEKFDKVELIYNQFKNAAVQITTVEQFLPVMPPAVTSAKKHSIGYIYEPNQDEIVKTLVPLSLKTQLFAALRDSLASEHGARMTAMHKATDNAGSLIKELKLMYNKARQAAITNEILEIVGGAEALNG